MLSVVSSSVLDIQVMWKKLSDNQVNYSAIIENNVDEI